MKPITRRQLLRSGAVGALALPAMVAGPATQAANLAGLRGSISDLGLNAAEAGIRAGAFDDQGPALQALLERAAQEHQPVVLPPGDYFVSNISFPANCTLYGVPGFTRLRFTGAGHFLHGELGNRLELSGLTIDGGMRATAGYSGALVRINQTSQVIINDCTFDASAETGVWLQDTQGEIRNCRIQRAMGECGLYLLDTTDMAISQNQVADCANGGILVHTSDKRECGAIVAENRISHIRSDNGGTGQWGNGINVFRAGSVQIAGNQIHDCDFSAIRNNGGDNVQITGNHCRRIGETAIYSEFEFVGAVISGNIIDGATIGVSIANFMQGGRMAVCSDNLIRNLKTEGPYPAEIQGFGIGISVEADTAVSGNVIENAPAFGISLGWGPYLRDVAAIGNIIRHAGVGISVTVVEGAGTAIMRDNIISDVRNGAIVGYRWREAATGDLANGGGHAFPHLVLDSNRVS